jgi:hypothetical protein
MGENLGAEDYSEERSRVMFRARWPEIMRPQPGLESQGPYRVASVPPSDAKPLKAASAGPPKEQENRSFDGLHF